VFKATIDPFKVAKTVDGYGRGLVAALLDGFEFVLNIYAEALAATAPNIVNRPNLHPFSDDVTRHIWTWDIIGPGVALFTNPRLRSLGDDKQRATSGEFYGGPRPFPISNQATLTGGADPNEDVSFYINWGYTREGAETARGYLSRGVAGLGYARFAWQTEAEQKVRAFYPDYVGAHALAVMGA